jgi:hypothetical protein
MFRENSRAGNFRLHTMQRNLGPAVAGLGEMDEVPWWCWDTPGFKQAHGKCWNDNDSDANRNRCIGAIIKKACPWDSPPEKEDEEAGEDNAEDKAKDFTASVTGFFKDKQGEPDPLKIGLVLLAGAVVYKKYKEGNR